MKLQPMCSHKFCEGCGYVTTSVFYLLITNLFIYLLIQQPLKKRII